MLTKVDMVKTGKTTNVDGPIKPVKIVQMEEKKTSWIFLSLLHFSLEKESQIYS